MKNSVKAIIIASVMGISGSAFAAQSIDNNPAIEITAEPTKTEIAFDDLPVLVQDAFKGSEYSEESINKIFQVVEEEMVKEMVKVVLVKCNTMHYDGIRVPMCGELEIINLYIWYILLF